MVFINLFFNSNIINHWLIISYVHSKDLESYISELIPTLPQLEGLEKSFHSFYVCTAVRKFFFFLDSMRTGRIRIRDILTCSFLEDLLEVCSTTACDNFGRSHIFCSNKMSMCRFGPFNQFRIS